MLRVVACAWLCGCGTTTHGSTSTAAKEARAAELLEHNAGAKCVLLDPTEIARAKPMRLSNASSFPTMYGELRASSSYEGSDEPPVRMAPLDAYYFAELTREQAEAAELERAGVTAERPEPIRVEAIADDGTVRSAEVMDDVIADGGSGHFVDARVLIHPDTRIVRLISAGRIIEELRRSTRVPEVDALILYRNPARVAVRVYGISGDVQVDLQSPGEDGVMYDTQIIAPKGEGADPCWMILPQALAWDDGEIKSLVLELNDAFHMWRFVSDRDPQD